MSLLECLSNCVGGPNSVLTKDFSGSVCKLIQRNRARRRALGDNHLGQSRLQNMQNAAGIFFGQNRNHANKSFGRKHGLDCLLKGLGSLRIVSCIQHHKRFSV